MNNSNFNHLYYSNLRDMIKQDLSMYSLANLKKIALDLKLPALQMNVKKKQLQGDILNIIFSKLSPESTSIDPHFPQLFNLDAPFLNSVPFIKNSVVKYNEMIKKSHPSYMNTFPSQPFFLNPMHNLINPALFRTTTSNIPANVDFENIKNSSNNIQNFNNFNSNNSVSLGKSMICFCSSLLFKAKTPNSSNILVCVNEKCKKGYHAECLKYSEKDIEKESKIFECPQCILLKNDPLHEVIETLVHPFLICQSLQSQQEFILNQVAMKKIYEDLEIGVEIKSIKLEGKYLNEQTWMDSGDLYLNSKKVMDFKPLQINSALKKRKDEKFFTRECLNNINIVKFNDIKPSYEQKNSVRYDENAIYIAGVFLVRKLKSNELIEKIQTSFVKSEEMCKLLIKHEFENQHFEDCKIESDRISISLLDTLDRQIIKTPAKTKFCSHLQCFSLENMVKLMENTIPRKWKCPICKVKAFDLIIDGYQWNIIKKIHENHSENVNDVIFYKDASYELKKSEEINMIDEDYKASPMENEEKISEGPNNRKINDKKNNIIILDDDDEINVNTQINKEINPINQENHSIIQENHQEPQENHEIHQENLENHQENPENHQENLENHQENQENYLLQNQSNHQENPEIPQEVIPNNSEILNSNEKAPQSKENNSFSLIFPSEQIDFGLFENKTATFNHQNSLMEVENHQILSESNKIIPNIEINDPQLEKTNENTLKINESNQKNSKINQEIDSNQKNSPIIIFEQDSDPEIHKYNPFLSQNILINLNSSVPFLTKNPQILRTSMENLENLFKERENLLQVHKNYSKFQDFTEFTRDNSLEHSKDSISMEIELDSKNSNNLKSNLKSRTFLIKSYKKQFTENLPKEPKSTEASLLQKPLNNHINHQITQYRQENTDFMIENEIKRTILAPVLAGMCPQNNNIQIFSLSHQKIINKINLLEQENMLNSIKNLSLQNQNAKINEKRNESEKKMVNTKQNPLKRAPEKELNGFPKKKNENMKTRNEIKEKGNQEDPICLD